jgi:hypothetical protein
MNSKALGSLGIGRAGKFAKFQVSKAAAITSGEIIRHVRESIFHQDALRFFFGETEEMSMGDTVEGVTTSIHKLGATVPRPERFVWVIQMCHRNASDMDYATFIRTNDLVSMAASEGVLRDASADACGKMRRAMGSVLDEEHRTFFKKSRRLAFAFDDSDQVLVLRGRLTSVETRICAKEFTIDVVKDYGTDTAQNADAAWLGLKRLCLIEKGKRHMKGNSRHPVWLRQTYIFNTFIKIKRVPIISCSLETYNTYY